MTSEDWYLLTIVGPTATVAVVFWFSMLVALGRTHRLEGKLRDSQQTAEQDDVAPAVVVHLVPGTYSRLPFGRPPPWIREGSKLREHLARALGGRVQFMYAKWSTMNSFSARQSGARALRESILGCAARWPHTRQVVVGHSHGGNVAVGAMQDARVEARVDAVVCLATPFLQSTLFHDPDAGKDHRQLKRVLGPMMAFVLFVAACAASGRRYLLPEWFWNWLALAHAPFVERLAGALLGVTVFLGALWASSRLLRNARRKWRRVIKEATAAPQLAPEKLQILRQPGDEAQAALGTLMLASWAAGVSGALATLPLQLLNRLVTQARQEGSWRARLLTSPFGAIACVALTALIGGVLFALWANSWPTPKVASALLFMITVTAVMLLWCAFGAIYGVLWLTELTSRLFVAFGAGYELALAGGGLLVTPESTPPGAWQVHNVDISGRAASNRPVRGRLWHSHLYSDDAALGQMAAFVACSVAKSKTPTPRTTPVEPA